MKHARKDLKVEGAVELPHVVAYLEQLVLALKAGTVRIRQEDEEVVLGPRGVIGFALSARDRGRRQSLALELTWRKFNAPDPDLDLHIDNAPAAAAATDAPVDASPADLAPATDAKGEAHEGEPHSAEAEPDASDA